MTKRALITGADGFIGSWLSEQLLKESYEVFAFSRREQGGRKEILTLRGDIRRSDEVRAAVQASKPDVVFHLAAQSHIQEAFSNPAGTFEVNAQGSLHLFEAIRLEAPQARVVSMGSSAEYGWTAEKHSVLAEDLPLLPKSPYGASKAAQGMLARIYAESYGLQIIHCRPFAIIGPRKTKDFLSAVCQEVVRQLSSPSITLRVGNLKTVRDFMDIRDFVRILVQVSETGSKGETYQLCTGVGTELQTLVDMIRDFTGKPFALENDPTKARILDDARLVGNPAKLEKLGCRMEFTLAETVRETLECWKRPISVP
jgi:GDP-4-dehydro-6-deoxy-D-mannose reductase